MVSHDIAEEDVFEGVLEGEEEKDVKARFCDGRVIVAVRGVGGVGRRDAVAFVDEVFFFREVSLID